MLSTTSSLRPLIHGHRGCRGLLPENTLPGFIYAAQLGVDVLEMDVVLSADYQVVVAHEAWLSARLGLSPTGQPINPRTEREYNIFSLPYATIRQSVVGVLAHPGFPEQQQITTYRPLLREVFTAVEATCAQSGRLPMRYAIEIKSLPTTDNIYHPTPDVFSTAVVATIPPSLLHRTTILSFDARILQFLQQAYPTIRLCYLVETSFTPELLFNELGFVPKVFGPDYKLLSASGLAQLRQLYPTLEVVPWTVNSQEELVEIISWQPNGITTDYPNRALQTLSS